MAYCSWETHDIHTNNFALLVSLWVKKAELFACCSLLVTFCSLLVTICSLLVTFCSLLLARCSLLCYSLLFARCSLLFACCPLFFRSNYFKIKLLWSAKKWFDYNETPPQMFSLQISEIFVISSAWCFSKFSQHAKPFSKFT